MQDDRRLRRRGTGRQALRLIVALSHALPALVPSAQAGGLAKLPFAPNPGRLGAYLYSPERPRDPAPLVVALHGCTQVAADFDDETGWTSLAEEAGFLLLLPEQSASNNRTRCFNWFNPRDQVRDGGEPESIRHMVEAVQAGRRVDPERVFIAGLSAGGGMTSVLLATHPDLFAGGAVVAGVPYGCAANALLALPCMRLGNRLVPGPRAWADKVFAAAPPGTARWPRVAIWHDAGDTLVNPVNAWSSMEQWTAVHGIDQVPDLGVRVGPHQRIVYQDAQGRSQVELWLTRGVGHATPIDARTGCGRDDPERKHDFVKDADICASRETARFWGLIGR
jgi:poly(hydroxyalkanoate) depolymerase family esterase